MYYLATHQLRKEPYGHRHSWRHHLKHATEYEQEALRIQE